MSRTLLAFALLLFTLPVLAQTNRQFSGDGDGITFSNANNWAHNAVPAANTEFVIIGDTTNGNQTVEWINSPNLTTSLFGITVGDGSGVEGKLTMSGTELTLLDQRVVFEGNFVGKNGAKGECFISDSTINLHEFRVGANLEGSDGLLSFSNSTINATGWCFSGVSRNILTTPTGAKGKIVFTDDSVGSFTGGDFVIGYGEASGTYARGELEVLSGSQITVNSALSVGVGSDGNNEGTVLVDDAAITTMNLFLGNPYPTNNGEMTIRNGANVEVLDLSIIGGIARDDLVGGTGTLTITGADTEFKTSRLGVSWAGTSGEVIHENGAKVEIVRYLGIGQGHAGNGFPQGSGTYTIRGTGSELSIGLDGFQVGRSGTGVLNIEDGATVSNGLFGSHIGTLATGNGTINLKPGGTLNLPGHVSVGDQGIGVINQTGGEFNHGDLLEIGTDTGSGTGIFNLTGGIFRGQRLDLSDSDATFVWRSAIGPNDVTAGFTTLNVFGRSLATNPDSGFALHKPEHLIDFEDPLDLSGGGQIELYPIPTQRNANSPFVGEDTLIQAPSITGFNNEAPSHLGFGGGFSIAARLIDAESALTQQGWDPFSDDVYWAYHRPDANGDDQLIFGYSFSPSSTEVTTSLDLNNNGVSDLYENRYNLTLPLNLTSDTDRDGYTLAEEIAAGTDPNDINDFLRVDRVSVNPSGDMWVQFDSKVGKSYYPAYGVDQINWTELNPGLVARETSADFILAGQAPPSYSFRRGALHQSWNSQSATSIADIFSLPEFPDNPNYTGSLENFSTLPNRGNQIANRLTAILKIPHSGEYQFALAGDDVAELTLISKGQRQTLVSATASASAEDHSSISAPVTLQQRAIYQLEVVHLDLAGIDFVSAFWKKPGDSSFSPIPKQSLIPFDLNTNRNESPADARYIKIRPTDTDSDGDGLTDWEETTLGFSPFSKVSFSGGLNDLNSAIQSLTSPTNVQFDSTPQGEAYESTGQAGTLTLERSGGLEPVTVSLSLSGTADTGIDYQTPPATISFARGQRSAVISITPLVDGIVELPEVAVVTIGSSSDYVVGSRNIGSITIHDAPAIDYRGALRNSGNPNSVAYGSVNASLAGNETFVEISTELNGLSSAQTAAAIEIVDSDGNFVAEVHSLPLGNLDHYIWNIEAAGGLTVAEIVQAVKEGRARITIKTANYTSGEIAGTIDTDTFVNSIPTPESTPSLGAMTEADAARFLMQATFHYSQTDIDRVLALGAEAWLDEQMALPSSSWMETVEEITISNEANYTIDFLWPHDYWHESWWKTIMTGNDRLRHRVAFALSEIFVVSKNGTETSNMPYALPNYFDMLGRSGFGSYRQLLENVTLAAPMAYYLSHIHNRAPDLARGIRPDENYAREVMQLFSVGLFMLNDDGTPKLDANGEPIPTYGPEHVTGMAHVFTGWTLPSVPTDGLPDEQPALPEPGEFITGIDIDPRNGADPRNRYYWANFIDPILPYDERHDKGEKLIITDHIIPAGRGTMADVQEALDVIAAHPNVGPFICKQLIQRLVTSNPSPGYVYRVSQVFNDNGSGVRGDLGAVIKAILLDYEARSRDIAETNPAFGKLKEPIIAFAQFAGAYPITHNIDNWRDHMEWRWGAMGQFPMEAPSVFNFFRPDYVRPGQLKDAGIVAPEFGIHSESTSPVMYNNAYFMLVDTPVTTEHFGYEFTDMPSLETLGATPEDLLDELDKMLLGGMMSSDLRTRILTLINGMSATNPGETRTESEINLMRARMAYMSIVASADYAIQR